MDIKYIIGVDPSFKTMGVAIKDMESGTMILKGGMFSDMIKFINQNADLQKAVIVVENPNLVSTTFRVWPMMKKDIDKYVAYEIWKRMKTIPIPEKFEMSDLQRQFSIGQKFGQSVGKNKAAADYTLTLFANKEIPTIEISPQKRDRADKIIKKAGTAKILWSSVRMPTKMKAEAFNKMTGYEGKSNEHSRDAATMIYDKTVSWCEKQLFKTLKKKRPASYPALNNNNSFLVNRESIIK